MTIFWDGAVLEIIIRRSVDISVQHVNDSTELVKKIGSALQGLGSTSEGMISATNNENITTLIYKMHLLN